MYIGSYGSENLQGLKGLYEISFTLKVKKILTFLRLCRFHMEQLKILSPWHFIAQVQY